MANFLDGVAKINGYINDIVWGWPVIILILGTGLLLTIRTKGMQFRKLKISFYETIVPTIKSLSKPTPKPDSEKKKSKTTLSQFEAFATAISGTVGTGNIIGVTSAILTGGPGAVFWMWMSALLGMVTNYSENVLGLYYRKKDEKGSFSGGAFYYITYGLHSPWLGYIAAVFCMLAALGMGGVQANKISGTLLSSLSLDSQTAKIIAGAVIALITGIVIIGGIQRIGKVASSLAPVMSLLFMVLAIVGICMNITALPKAFVLIFSNIFGFKAMAGGFGGYLFGQVIKKGLARGVFSNEAGLGSSVIAHSASDTKEPVKQGLWGVFEVFFDTFVVCTLTAFLVLTTFIRSGELESFSADTSDAVVSLSTFTTNFGTFGTVCFSIILPLFAFTTIIAWAYYGEKAVEFCFRRFGKMGKKISVLVFKVVFLGMILSSAVIESDLVWDLSDTANGLMAIPNLIALILLSGTIVKITKNYFGRQKGKQVEPLLSAYPELNEEFKQEIKKEE